MIYVIIGLIVAVMLLLILLICQHSKNKDLKIKLEQKTEAYNGLRDEFELFRKTEQFRQKKEEEVNEKINEVLSGDSVANAIDVLSKH